MAPGWPGAAPSRYQPTCVSSGTSSWPSGAIPTLRTGACAPIASIVIAMGATSTSGGTGWPETASPTSERSGERANVVVVVVEGVGLAVGDGGSVVADFVVAASGPIGSAVRAGAGGDAGPVRNGTVEEAPPATPAG